MSTLTRIALMQVGTVPHACDSASGYASFWIEQLQINWPALAVTIDDELFELAKRVQAIVSTCSELSPAAAAMKKHPEAAILQELQGDAIHTAASRLLLRYASASPLEILADVHLSPSAWVPVAIDTHRYGIFLPVPLRCCLLRCFN
jgi:hypothetical protein